MQNRKLGFLSLGSVFLSLMHSARFNLITATVFIYLLSLWMIKNCRSKEKHEWVFFNNVCKSFFAWIVCETFSLQRFKKYTWKKRLVFVKAGKVRNAVRNHSRRRKRRLMWNQSINVRRSLQSNNLFLVKYENFFSPETTTT